MSQHACNALINLLLKLRFRHTQVLFALFLSLFAFQILVTDDLFRRGFRKWNFPDIAAQNALKGRQLFIVFFDDLGHGSINISDIRSLRILVVRVHLCADHVICPVHQNVLDQALIFKEIFQFLRCYILTVA